MTVWMPLADPIEGLAFGMVARVCPSPLSVPARCALYPWGLSPLRGVVLEWPFSYNGQAQYRLAGSPLAREGASLWVDVVLGPDEG